MPDLTSVLTLLSCVSRPFQADLTESLFAGEIAAFKSVVAVDMSADSTDCEACAFRSSIVSLYVVSALPEYALQPGSEEPLASSSAR